MATTRRKEASALPPSTANLQRQVAAFRRELEAQLTEPCLVIEVPGVKRPATAPRRHRCGPACVRIEIVKEPADSALGVQVSQVAPQSDNERYLDSKHDSVMNAAPIANGPRDPTAKGTPSHDGTPFPVVTCAPALSPQTSQDARTAPAAPPPSLEPENAPPPVYGPAISLGGGFHDDAGDEPLLDWQTLATAPDCTCGHPARFHRECLGSLFHGGCTFRPMSIGFGPGAGPCSCTAYRQEGR